MKGLRALCASLFALILVATVVGYPGKSPASVESSPPVPTCTDSLQAAIDGASPGDTVEAESCVYREEITITKPITLQGQPGSEIRGSEVWKDWEDGSGYWRSKKVLPEFPQTNVECMPGTRRCLWPEQVFVDGEPWRQVADDPETGEFAVDHERRVVLGDDPKGRYVEVTVRRYWVLGKSGNVTIRGFAMRHAANGGRSGAIMNRMARLADGYPNWAIQNNLLSDAHGAVVSLTGATGLKILENEIYRGGQLGIKSTGPEEIIRGNNIHHNNTEDFDFRWEAGGMKTSTAEGVIVDSNEFHENGGNAIWFDVNSSYNTITDNRIHHNARHGIHYEISEEGRISGNVLWENGWSTTDWVLGSAISSANSSGMEIHRNTLAWNADGIAVVGLDRAGDRWDRVENVRVDHNTILAEDDPAQPEDKLALGWMQGWSDQMFEPESNNRGWANRYWYAAPEGGLTRYEWAKDKYASIEGFNATPGEEGRYLSDEEKIKVIAEADIPAAPEQRGPSSTGVSKKDSKSLLDELSRTLRKVVPALEKLVSSIL